MKQLTLSLALLLVFCLTYAQKTWVSFTSDQSQAPSVQLIQSDHSGLVFDITIPGMFSEEITEQNYTFQRISLIENLTTKDVGRPELPMLHELIGIPDNQKVSFKILEKETVTLNNFNIYPFQTPTTDNPGGHSHEFVIDEKFYQKSANYPAENILLGEPGIWRDVKISGLHITPFTYNPATGDLEVITHLKLQIEFYGFDNNMVLNRSKTITPKFYKMYNAAISNFGSLGYTETLRDEPSIKYLIITNTETLDAIEPLVNWKNEQGCKVEVKTLEAGFNTPQQFKDYIALLYESDGLEYVLMVGDAYPNGGSGGGPNIVPMYWWKPSGEDGSYSDSWYSCMDGPDDHYADLAIGRLTYNLNSLDELELQIDKTMTHYLTPDVSDNWAENSILIAHKEDYPGKYTQCCEEIRLFPYSVQVPIFETAYGGAGASNQDVIDFVNNTACGIFNYRGHGSDTELWQWGSTGSFTATHVAQLTNEDKLFVFFDVCCDNMNIVTYNGNCLCESFMKHPTASIAVNGAIIPSYTIPNHDYDKEMYKAIFNEDITNIGYITNTANAFVLDNHGIYGRSNVRTYLWLGDASLEPWTLQPMTLTVTHDGQLFLGITEFPVNVIGDSGPIENAMVCVSNEDGSVYAVAYTDNTGMALVTFDSPVQIPGDVKITVTVHNYLPYQAVIPVIPQEGPYVVKDSYLINDVAGGNGNGLMDYGESILLTLSVKNVGIIVAVNVVVTLSTNDEYITITDDVENYGNIEPDQIVTIEDAFAFDVADSIPDGHAALFVVSATDGDSTWVSNIVIQGHAPNLKFEEYTIDDSSGNNNGILDPGETAIMIVTVKNDGSSDAYNVIGLLASSDPNVTVLTTEPQEYGDLLPDETADANFTVSASEEIPAGYVAILDIYFTADLGISQQDIIELLFADFCYPTANCSYGDGFTGFSLETISNMNSGCSTGGYGDFTNMSADLEPETTYTVQWKTGYSDQYACLWIDLNGNKEFEESERLIDDFHMSNSGQVYSTDFTVPASVTSGEKRLRIRANWQNSAADPCANFTYGETEDYTVVFNILTANFTADVTEGCEELTVNFTDNSIGDIISWEWDFEGGDPATSTVQNPTVFYADTGVYDVTLIVGDGTLTDTLTKNDYISVFALPVVTFTEITDMCINWPPYELIEGAPAGGEYSGPGVEDGWFYPDVAGLGTHTLTYTYVDNNGCENFAEQTIYVDACVGIDEVENESALNIYPNPFNNSTKILFSTEENCRVKLSVFNFLGKEITTIVDDIMNSGTHIISFDATGLEPGIYLVRLQHNQNIFTKKITIIK